MRPHLFVAVALAVPLVFQARQPDFSGTWIATADAPFVLTSAGGDLRAQTVVLKKQ